jgi:hypothetical protein
MKEGEGFRWAIEIRKGKGCILEKKTPRDFL